MNEGGVLRRSIDHPLLHAISCLSTATVAVVFGAVDDGRTNTKSHRAKTPLSFVIVVLKRDGKNVEESIEEDDAGGKFLYWNGKKMFSTNKLRTCTT
ncbi:unnamed protein product [Lactuca virosa]|uniref:Uncharacterized protein n=1 Tax=Lactuca virosa TaxID=75947 RepID=A0AAU9NSB8_9ASTR|nr:unnamed protein product [Lactuca virosa]